MARVVLDLGLGCTRRQSRCRKDMQVAVWLATGGTDMQRLGGLLGMCHGYMLWQNGSTDGLAFTREALERELQMTRGIVRQC